jgi:hypothetical protein
LSCLAADPPRYALQDLGTVVPTAIDDVGQIVGKDGRLFEHGAWTAQDPLHVTAISGLGRLAGTVGGPDLAVVATPGGLQNVGVPDSLAGVPRADLVIVPSAINNSGVVVGGAADPPGGTVPWIYANGKISEISGTGPGEDNQPVGINAHGVVVGFSMGNGENSWILANGAVTQFGANQSLRALAINDNGVITGHAGFDDQAFLYADGHLTLLPNLPHRPWEGQAINNRGEVVGTTTRCCSFVGLLYDNGVTFDLNDLLTPAEAQLWHITGAVDINERGQIVGTARLQGGQTHGILLTPIMAVPEVSTSALWSAGMACVLAVMRVRLRRRP